jgi:hypothetical protein
MYIPQHLQNSAYFPTKTEEPIFIMGNESQGGTYLLHIHLREETKLTFTALYFLKLPKMR